MRSFGNILRRLAVVLFWPALIVVTWGEVTPSPPHLEAHIWDKLLHFTAYFGLTALASISLRSRRAALLAVLALIAYGGALEIVQGFTGRDADWLDEAANALGALTGFATATAFLWLVDRVARD